MKKSIVISALLLLATSVSFSASANSCDYNISRIEGLDQITRQQMIVQCEQQKLNKAAEKTQPSLNITEVVTEENLEKITVIAKAAGETVREVAKELNIATNEFIKTPVGMLTAGLAVWYVAGDSITGLAAGVWDVVAGLFLVIGAFVFLGMLRKKFMFKEYETYTYNNIFGKERTKTRKAYYSWSEINSNAAVMPALITVAEVIAYIVGAAHIF